MSILRLFSGASPEKLEKKGDAFYAAGLWGKAKLEYEHAHDKLEKAPDQGFRRQQLAAKIIRTKEALGEQHFKEAEAFAEGGYFDEALNMLALAFEVTPKNSFKTRIKERTEQIEALKQQEDVANLPNFVYNPEDEDNAQEMEDPSPEEYFEALCGPLPPEVYEAYMSYGRNFMIGYIALNQADFETAADNLAQALEQNPQPGSYIPIELASAYFNLDRTSEAQTLLEGFLEHHPDTLPAYQLLCEIYWEQKDFERVSALLESIPSEVAQSLAVALLKGETLFQSGDFAGANKFYRDFFDTYGFNEAIAAELAKTYEALGQPDQARQIYQEMIGNCSSCHTQVDPMIKHKYAELSFAAGMHSTDILEIYLSLAQQIPDNAAGYFDRVSRIYESQGNEHEAARFRNFSQNVQTGRK